MPATAKKTTRRIVSGRKRIGHCFAWNLVKRADNPTPAAAKKIARRIVSGRKRIGHCSPRNVIKFLSRESGNPVRIARLRKSGKRLDAAVFGGADLDSRFRGKGKEEGAGKGEESAEKREAAREKERAAAKKKAAAKKEQWRKNCAPNRKRAKKNRSLFSPQCHQISFRNAAKPLSRESGNPV